MANSQSLADAVRAAISGGKKAAARLKTDLDHSLEKSSGVIDGLTSAATGQSCPPEVKALVGGIVADFAASRSDIEALFVRQTAALEKFNIVLFGRTGVGKSTLVEIFTEGVGKSVSDGRSDNTTEVTGQLWRGCGNVIDTPGIGGWGRTVGREELEARAREAAEQADVVLLAFDSQNQQAHEFSKVADWIARYNKPAVAVLNVRNAKWRHPDKVGVGSARRTLSQTVYEHAAYISEQLEKVGLAGIPVVALSAKRAIFGRRLDDYVGPDKEAFHAQRRDFGAPTLLEWSNFGPLEDLIAEALREDANRLRLAMLNDELRGAVAQLRERIAVRVTECQTASKLQEDFILTVLRIVGQPDSETRTALRAAADGRDLLRELEDLRRGSFDAPQDGEAKKHAEQLATAALGELRARSLRDGEERVAGAFERREALDGPAVWATIFNKARIQAALNGVGLGVEKYLRTRLEVEAADFRTDVGVSFGAAKGFDGSAGAGKRWTGIGFQLGGVASGIGLSIALLLGPVGWVAAGVATAVSLVAGWFGGRLREKAEKERWEARSAAIAQVRQAVHRAYDQLAEQLSLEIGRTLRTGTVVKLAPLLTMALVTRQSVAKLATVDGELAVFANRLQPRGNNAEVFQAAMRRVEQADGAVHGPGVSAWRKLWLGERWVDDPRGLLRDHDSEAPQRGPAVDPTIFERLRAGFTGLFSSLGARVKMGAGVAWLERALAELGADPVAAILAALRPSKERRKARVYVVGDYSSGKSSFIKRLLLEASLPIPAALAVRADPTTEQVNEYEWEGLILVDCPGFQSTNPGHTELALQRLPEAAAVIYVFAPNIVSGDKKALRGVLLGDEERGLLPKLERTVFLLNRVDELGHDPEDNAAAFVQMCERRRLELRAQLAREGASVDERRILPVASDPYGLMGNRRDINSRIFDPFRTWDGIAQVLKSIRLQREQFEAVAPDLSILERGVAALAARRLELQAGVAQFEKERAATQRLDRAATRLQSEAYSLIAATRERLRRAIESMTSSLLQQIFDAPPDQLAARAGRVKKWWEQPEFQVDAEAWATQAQAESEKFARRVVEELSRQLNSVEVQSAGVNVNAAVPHFSGAAGVVSGVGKAASTIGQILKGAEQFGGKTLLGTATKAAKTATKVGRVLVVLSVLIDIADFVNSFRAEKKRAQAKEALSNFLDQTGKDVLAQFMDGYSGPAAMAAIVNELEVATATCKADERRLDAEVAEATGRLKTCHDLIARAKHAIGGAN